LSEPGGGDAAPPSITTPSGDSPAIAAATAKPSSDLWLRVASALVMAVLALGSAAIGGSLFGLFWTIAGLLVLREWIAIVGIRERGVAVWAAGAVALAFAGVLAENGSLRQPVLYLCVAAGAALAATIAPRARVMAALGVLYASVVIVVPVALRTDPAHGLLAILWLFAVVWLTDIGAYFAGRTLGGPKLWPRISPKKTWSGFIGGVLAGTLCAIGVVLWGGQILGVSWYGGMDLVLLSGVAAVLSQGGDLLESAMKRRFEIKDSSHLIPGHGGVMDRLDSFWAVCLLIGVVALAGGGAAR
jgi:phosphatidate cytidylyltransferase